MAAEEEMLFYFKVRAFLCSPHTGKLITLQGKIR